jgi:hypothetical protein
MPGAADLPSSGATPWSCGRPPTGRRIGGMWYKPRIKHPAAGMTMIEGFAR